MDHLLTGDSDRDGLFDCSIGDLGWGGHVLVDEFSLDDFSSDDWLLDYFSLDDWLADEALGDHGAGDDSLGDHWLGHAGEDSLDEKTLRCV